MKKYLDRISDLESQISTANAKIVELEEDRNYWKKSADDYSFINRELSAANKEIKDLKESVEVEKERAQVFVDYANTANKKVEKLLKVIEVVADEMGCDYDGELQRHCVHCDLNQALKECRGEK